MGRVKTTLVKRVTGDLIKEYGGEFKGSFDENKEAVDRILDVKSKKIRNAIAGYITRIKKNEIKAS